MGRSAGDVVGIHVDHLGKQTITQPEEIRGLAGRYFARREPVGDAGDLVVAMGLINVGSVGSGAVVELVISSAEFAAIPEGWESPTTSYDFEAFADEYREVDAATIKTMALEQSIAAKAATEALEKDKQRESPWSRS